MGSHSCHHKITAATKAEAIAKAKDYQQACQIEHGNGAYSGHLGTAGIGATVLSTEFADVDAAVDYIIEKHDKWDLPMLARIKGTDNWVLAGWCSS